MDPTDAILLTDAPWPAVYIRCVRCERQTTPSRAQLERKYGNVTLGEAARRVAADGGCALAVDGADSICAARPLAPPIEHWASLDQARRLGYAARLHCRRHLAALKRTRPCVETWDLDLDTLVSALGYDALLERLPGKLRCPGCHTQMVHIEWVPPLDRPTPAGTAPAPALAPRRSKGKALAARQLKVVKGGR